MKLLVVEDSQRLSNALKEGLRRLGYAVDVARNGRDGLAFAESNDYDVIILDIMLPGLDGLSLLKRLRDRGGRAEVLILSAKDQVQDRVAGLELGADDYLVKPFAFEELAARIKVLARRPYDLKQPLVAIGNTCIDTARRMATVDGREVVLTPREYSLLEYLALRRGRVVSKSQLHEALYDADSETESNVIEVLVSNLRRKIRQCGADNIVHTRRGFGYFVQ